MSVSPSIFNRLLILVCAVALPFSALIGYGLYLQFRSDRDRGLHDLRFLREINERQLVNYVGRAQAHLTALAGNPLLREGDPEKIAALLQEFLHARPEYDNIGYVDPAGRVLASPRYPANYQVADQPHYRAAMEAQDFYAGQVFLGTVAKIWSCVLSSPVRDATGRRIGTLIIPLDLPALSATLNLPSNRVDLAVGVVDGAGTVLLHAPHGPKYIGRKLPGFGSIQAAMARGQFEQIEQPGLDDQPRTWSAHPLPGTPWSVYVSVPTPAIFAEGRSHLWRALITIIAGLTLSAALGAIFARQITRPVTALAKAARDRNAGRLDVTAPVAGPREIAETARAFNDMIARQRADEQALLESERRYRELFQNNPHPMWVYDLDDLRILDVNFAALAHYGFSREEFLSFTLKDIRPPEDIPALLANIQRLRGPGGAGTSMTVVMRHRKKTGEHIFVEVTSHPLTHADRATRLLLAKDITESRRATQALAESEARQRAMFNSALDAIITIDHHGRVIDLNPAAERIFGYTRDRILDREMAEIVPLHLREAHRHGLVRALATGQSPLLGRRLEMSALHASGREFPIELTVTRIQQDPPLYTGFIRDLTELKQAEIERQHLGQKLLETQKLESLGVLAGGIAHDFNNLLTGILGNAGLARLDLPPGRRGTEYIDQIEKASLRAADLCKQMLAYSGKGRFVIQNLDLSDLLEDTTQLLQVSISKRATLRFNLARHLPPIQADATQIRQIVMNLVINASEALNERTGIIILSTGHLHANAAYLAATQYSGDPAPGHYVFLEVGDDGIGMTRETLARIFDPFFTTKFTGRGLGLAAVLGIVRGHKGAIKVYSEPGRGTTFKLLFPASEGPPQELQTRPPKALGWRSSGRVLIVDDEEAVSAVAANVLKVLGFTVDTAADGHAALDLFKSETGRYQLVLLDLTMPRMDGEETFRALRQLKPDVKVILMSGFNKVDAINRFTGKGLAGFVQKPFDVDTLAAELRRVLHPPDSKPS
jgi:PAS domain S-box-containing protein